MPLSTSQPIGYVQDAGVGASAKNLPAAPSTGSTYAVIAVEGNGIRYRDDGTDPTATIGMPVASGGTVTYTGNPTRLRVIAQTGTATVNVTYYAARNPAG